MKDIVYAKGRELPNIGIAYSPAAFDKGVAQTGLHFTVGIGKRRIVEITAKDDEIRGTTEVAGYLFRLFCPVAGGYSETGSKPASPV